MAFINDVFQTDPLATGSTPGFPEPGSLFDEYIQWDAARRDAPLGQAYDPMAGSRSRVDRVVGQPAARRPLDPLQLDPDPFGTETAKWARQNGVAVDSDRVMSLDVFDRTMSREQLEQSDSGRRLLEIAERRRKGQKRSFWDAITDWSWEDAPFVSLFATVGKSLSDAATVSDTFKKLQNGESVTDEELLKTRLYMAENEEREDGTWGATVGDIMRAAPGFVMEFFATGSLYSLARAGLSRAGKAGIHLGMTRATKVLAREAMQEAAESAVAKGAAKGAAGFAALAADDAAKKGVVKEVADKILVHTMKGNPMYRGIGDDALKELAKSRAEYEFSKMVARNAGGRVANGFNKFTQWLGQNASRGLMDFGQWGTEESTVMFTARSKATRALADAVGTFLVDAPLKGAMMWAPNQLLARPVVSALAGGRVVSSAQLGLEAVAYQTGNRELMENAEWMAHGLSLLEYVSENTGRGLTSLMRAAGIGLEKAGVRGLVRPAVNALGVAEDKMDAVSLGGRMRQWVESVFGSRKDYARKTTQDKVRAVARKLGVSGDADMSAIQTAVLSNSTNGLRADLASKVGADVSKFAMQAVKELTDKERLDFQYKTFGKFMFADWMARHQVGPETVMNMFDRLGYDGVLGEMFEERYSDFAKGLFGWDDRTDHDLWSNLKTAVKNLYPGWDQLTAEATAFAMPMVIRSGIMRVQAAVAGGGGKVREIRQNLAGINDAMRVGTVATMTPGEYLEKHQRDVEADDAKIRGLQEERERQAKAMDQAVNDLAEARVAEARERIEERADKAYSKALEQEAARGASPEEAEARAQERRQRYIDAALEGERKQAVEEETARLNAPGGAGEALSQLDADIKRATTVKERREELHRKFSESIPEAAEDVVREIAVPLYTDDDLADDTRFNQTPLITAQQAGEVIAGQNAMVDYAPSLSRSLVEMESRLPGESMSWWRRAAHRLVGVAGALATGDFSIAAANPAQWTARDMGLTDHVVGALKANFRKFVKEARSQLEDEGREAVETVARMRADAETMRASGAAEQAAETERQADAVAARYGTDGAPSYKAVMDRAEELAAPSARRIMSANLAAHQLRSFTKTRVRDQALGVVARELGYEWYVDDNGGLRFFKYGEDGKIDEASAMDAETFSAENRERVDETAEGITEAAVDILTHRLTRSGDESVRLLNAVTAPDPGELRLRAQARQPGLVGPVAQDAVMREAALYDAAMRMVGEGSVVERVRVDNGLPISETLDRGGFGRVNMATVDYLSRFDKAEDADPRAFEALAWSLGYPFDGTEEGLAKRNRELFGLAKIATHMDRPDKAYYSLATPIDDEEASRLTPNGSLPLTATLVDGVWTVDMGRTPDGTPLTRPFATRDEMDAELRKLGYTPDKSRIVFTLARAIESADMFDMLRQLGLGVAYRDAQSSGNVHPMLRKKDGRYVYENEEDAQAALRAELMAAEGGERAPKGSAAHAAWEKVWGENGYMRVGERILRDHGVRKSTLAKYAGEFSDWSPAVYTLTLSAGRISPSSANVYVPVDPLVSPDIKSGALHGVLMQAFLTHPRFLMDKVGGVLSDFADQINAVIERHIAATKDSGLKADLERFRRAVTSDVDRAEETTDGTYVLRRGVGMDAERFTVLASAFVLGREADYQANPHLRAVSEIASDVRMCPAFADFYDVVDLTLGGSGPITSAARVAAGAEVPPESQRGLSRLMAYASSDPAAMERKLKEMRPLGLEPRQFLDLCMRRLTAMAKSGAPAVPAKEAETLRAEAEAASAEKPTPRDHWTFYGHLMEVVKRSIDTDRPVDVSTRDFFRDLAEAAQDDPGVTEKQKKALRSMLGILTRTRVVRDARTAYVNAYLEGKTAEQRYNDARKARRARSEELRRAKERKEFETSPNTYEARRQSVTETRRLEQHLKEEYTKSLKAVEDAKNQVKATMKAGDATSILGWDAVWTRTPTEEEDREEIKKTVGDDVDVSFFFAGDGASADPNAAEDDTPPNLAVAGTDAVELPETAALGEDKTVMSHGFTEVPSEMEQSVQRLAVNVCVRAVAMSARPGPDADPLAPVVTEDSVVAMAKKLFHLDDREADALRFHYRVADEQRMAANRTWDDFARPGARWEFQEDDKADDDVSSDYFLNRAAAEYNSPFLADALALAARVAPESGTNLRAFVARTKEWLRQSVAAPLVPGVTKSVDGVPVVWESSSDGHVSSAWYDPKDKSIHVHADGVREKFASEAWRNPARSGAIPGAERLIKTADDLVSWAVYHELGHARDTATRGTTAEDLAAREDRANAFASSRLDRARRQAAVSFALSLLDPRLDPRGKTQAEQSALHMKALSLFEEDPGAVSAHVEALMSPDKNNGGFPVSRRLAFLLSYMAALPMEDRRNFALLCANSVSAQAVNVGVEFGEDGSRTNVVKERRVGAGDKISDRIVSDTFVHVLEGKGASEAAKLAQSLRGAQAEALRRWPRAGAEVAPRVAAWAFAQVFGRESPLCTALSSKAAADYRKRSVGKSDNAVLLESVTPTTDGRIPVVESVAAQLESLAARGGRLTADNVTAAFVALFETGRPDKEVGVRRLDRGPSITDPLKMWLSTYGASLPATILSADVDQRRESRGSSVPIAPRDSVPMVSRWIYSDEPMLGFVDGRLVTFPTFTELARQAFPGRTDAEYERCRQDACWPDGTPVCAKNTSSSLTTRELYLACENAYNGHVGDAWYIPLYAGDHSSSTMLRIPWSVKMDGFMKAAQAPSENQVPAAPADTGPMNVWYSTGENAEFSNLAERPFEYEGHRYVSVEHAYQTLKSGSFDEGLYRKPWAAGKKFRGKPADTSKNVQLMRTLVLESFRQNPDAAADLVATGPRKFTHTQDQGVWAKEFPAALEAARAALQGTTSRTDLVRVSFPEGNSHKGKDERKFNQLGGLTKFIGFGTGSTGLYAKALAAIANKETYTKDDIVGVSVNGKRPGRVPVRGTDVERLVRAAAQAGATIIADEEENRTDYNLGERELAELLRELGYSDTNGNGVWRPSVAPAALGYHDAAKAMSYAVGMNLMYTDTKRSAITSLENQGAGLIGAEVQDDGTVKYGEHRVHIIHNWAFEREGFSFKNKNEALLGTTRMYGYGARTMKTLAKDRKSDLLKMHLISTSGRDLFFIKSLSVAISEDENDSFLDGTMNRVIEDYARSFRGDDGNSTDTYTDDDSYKIGVGNSKAILVQAADGKRQKLMAWLFSRLRDLCGAAKDASEEDVAKAFKSAYGKLTGDALDELVGDVPVVDLARTDGKSAVGMKLSELMPGVMVNAVEGLDGPCLDLSYREDGAMAYTVANVSHSSRVSNEPGRTPRNYEMDMLAAATMLGTGAGATLDGKTFQDAFELVANWGLVAACVYATKPNRDAAAANSVAAEKLRLNGEHPYGQNIRSEVARAVWASVRENANLPVKGVDAALVACGASIDENNRLMAHTKSRMQLAMMRGAEIFTADEQSFFGRKFRHALCNVNMTAPGFRHAWFLDREAFNAGGTDQVRRRMMTDREVVKELKGLFTEARRLAEAARAATGDEKKAAEARLLAAKKGIARMFVDHHGLPIWSDDPAKSGRTEAYVRQFSLSDLFDRDGNFDLSAFQIDGDRVHNDATGQEHILLGGTKFGFPRTPSYNAHYETVRAGLPVKERSYVDANGQTRWRVGGDAMVSPDPYTNKVLGTDHDGDKSKLYLLHTDRYGLADEADPGSLAPSDDVAGALEGNKYVEYALPDGGKATAPARDLYTKRLAEGKWLEKVWVNPETGKEEPVPAGESPEGAYLRVSDQARLRVSNAFVRTMFTISDSVPTLGMDGNERVSESASRRIKCLGGIAFRPVSTQPVLTDTAWKEITKNAMPPVLGPGETIGDPWLAALVSTSAEDADGARGTVVSLARTLHVAYASGMFADLFGGRQPGGMEWLAFLNHFDGLSNATFDDIKEQICGRLGWTKGMMDTVLVELLSSIRGGIPTEDAQWAKILGDYAKNVRDGKAEYWMLKASSVEEDEFVERCRVIVGAEKLSKEAMHAAMGVEFDESTKHWKSTGKGTAPLARVMSLLYDLCQTDAERAGFDYLVTSANGKLGHNSTLGRLAYLVSSMATLPSTMTQDEVSSLDMVRDTNRWAVKRAQLAKAQKFERAVNYLTADPGDANKFAKYGAESDEDAGDTASVVKGGGTADGAFRRMETATRMMYRAAGNLATVEASAVLAAVQREENLEELAETDPEAEAFLFVKDALPQWDRMGLTANRQQLPYLMSLFLRQANIAGRLKDADGNWLTSLHDGAQLYGAVQAMAASVAGMWRDEAGNTLATGKGLAARLAIESLFSVMYRLMTTSTEFADGATLPAYLRAPADTNFEEKDYGRIGTMLKRIMPGYRSNDAEAHRRIRGMYEDILAGRAYGGARKGNWTNADGSPGVADCKSFALARGENRGKDDAIRGYITELIPPGAFRQEFRTNAKLTLADVKARYPEQMAYWNEVEVAAYALFGLEQFLGVGKGQAAVTPAMMFGQLLPLYSLMTSRCLGAPDPSSPSILALAPSWVYEEISAGEAELSTYRPELVNSVVAGNWAPYLENVRRTGKKKRWDPKTRKSKLVDVKVKDVDALAAERLAPAAADPHPAAVPDTAEAAEHRENPDWRTTVDIFSDGAFEAALKAAGPSRMRAVPAAAPAPGPAPKGRGAYDRKVARVAGALGLAFPWATVEYTGGKTFTVRGKLKGTVGQGRNVVFTVDMDGRMCDSDAQVQALADSEAYGASLAECCPGLGLRSGRDFLGLKRDVRVALVKRYGVGGATNHHVQWKFDGKGVATLVGAIRLGTSKADTTVFHEYFHEMMRVFDAVGLFSEADKEALRKTFGKPARKGQWFNEERAAEEFRKWVEKRMEPEAKEARGLFRKIYEALKGILLAIRRGFGYTDDSDRNMELLFGFAAHGIAQASESRVAELTAGAARASSIAKQAGAQQAADRLADAAVALDAAYLARNDVAVATAIAQIVPPPGVENARVSTATVAAVEAKAERRKEDSLKPVAMREDYLDYELDSAPEFDSVDPALQAATRSQSEELVAMLEDPSTPAALLEEKMLTELGTRRQIAEAMGRWLPEPGEANGPESTDTGAEGLDFAPGSAEAAVDETRRAVKAVTTPMAEVNDFYRAANFIHEALERELADSGSWKAPLADIANRYGRDGVSMDRDAAVVLHGLRGALEAIRPGSSLALDDERLRRSLAFEAALRMYHGLDAWAHSRTKAAGGTPLPAEAGSDEACAEATQYDVSAWILSSRPLSAAQTLRSALGRTEALLAGRGVTPPVRAELLRHRDALRGVLEAMDDETGLMDFRNGNLKPVFDRAFAALREGLKMNGHGPDGRLADLTANLDEAERYEASGMTRALDRMESFGSVARVPAVQESLKSALTALWQAQAQAKFYRETDVTPATAEDMEDSAQMALRHNAPYMTAAEWAETQAIGDSNLADNRALVDFYCRPAFIAADPEVWLQSLVRRSFGAVGNIGEMLSAENREYGALKMRIADLENFYSLLLGTNVEDGGYLLKVEKVRGKWKRRWGEIVREDGKDEHLKVDNYRRKPTHVQMTEADLRVVDLYLKSLTAYAKGQDRVVTGLNRLWFSAADFEHDWSPKAVEDKWNEGDPAAHMTPMEMMLHRLDTQFPEDVLHGTVNLRGRIVAAAEAALAKVRGETSDDASALNRAVLKELKRQRLVEVNGDSSFGVVTIPVDDLNDMFLQSDAYGKVTSAERGLTADEWAKLLDRDRIRDDFLAVWRDTARFARKHAWLLHGDGQHFHNFGTTLPFWRGDGVFMYNCVRTERDAPKAAADKARTAAAAALYRTMGEEDVDQPLEKLEYAKYAELLDRVGEAYAVPAPGARLAEDVKAGRYEEGAELAERTKLVLPRDATKADLARALYRKALEDVHGMALGAEAQGLRDAEEVIEAFESSALERGELFADTFGLNDLDVYRIHGKLPANAQIGHAVHIAIDGVTNAMMSRATLANLLMTPAADGAPVYYADPSEYAADVSGLPDEFWANVARWWAEWNKLEYDGKLTGVQNAKAIYRKLLDSRDRNRGKIGTGEYAKTYTELSRDDSRDCLTVDHWLVRDDDRTFEESSVVNSLSGGEAMGYLKQFVQAGRALGFGGAKTRATLHRALSWSKSMSVAFSLFFPLATKWESPIGAVGATATIMSNLRGVGEFLRKHPELANMMQKAVGGKGWVTQNFLGFHDVIEMMDTNDPFLAEMKAWANALGVTLSSSLVNPMEETKSVMTEDLRWLKERVRDRMGSKAAAKFGRIVETVVTRGGDKAFNYALNATKLAVVAQMCMKLRHQAQARGKAFDPVRDLRRYGRYINAEIGGIDPLRYAWATPLNRGLMNTLLFSWQWTRGAWEAGGGAVLEDLLLGGHTMTKEEREYAVGRWCRMFGAVMIGVPAMMQCVVMGLAKALGGGDDGDDHWATWENEDKTKWTAFDLTPLLRAIERSDATPGANGAGALLGGGLGALAGSRFGSGWTRLLATAGGAAAGGVGGGLLPEGALRRIKQAGGGTGAVVGAGVGAALGRMNGGNAFTSMLGGALGAVGGASVPALVPLYTGEDAANRTSRARRYYMHFGKQGWEFFRWFEDAKGQFFSKLSMPTQRILEGVMGRNLSYLDRALPWDEMGQFERWLNPTSDGALFNLAQAFLPFSLGGVQRTGDAGFLPIVGPVQMGASQTNIQDRLVKVLTAWARNDRTAYAYGTPAGKGAKASKLLSRHVADILRDAKANGLDPEQQLNKAYGQVATKLYGELVDLIPDDPRADYDARAVERAARAVNRIGAKKAQVLKSLKARVEARLKARGLTWKSLPAEDRARYANVVANAVGNPFGTYDY